MGQDRAFRAFSRGPLLCAVWLALALAPGGHAEDTLEAPGPAVAGFIENRGQIDAAARYYAGGERAAVYFTREGVVFEIRERGPRGDEAALPLPDYPTRRREQHTLARTRRYAMAVRFVDPSPSMSVGAEGPLAARHNFLVGGDRERWRTGVPSFERVVFREVWPGIDLEYRLDGDRLVYRVVASPGADLAQVRFAYDGVGAVTGTDEVKRLETPLGPIEHRRATAGTLVGSVRIGGASPGVDADGESSTTAGPRSFAGAAAQLGMELSWSSFLGGSRDDTVYAVAVAEGGFPVVAGITRSTEFPTTLGAVQPDYAGSFDAFVAKFDYDGSSLLWSTYLGGSDDDRAWAIEIDSTDRPVVAGVTASDDFPVSPGAYDTVYGGEYDAYVALLAADGSAVVWASYYGGTGREWDVSGLALDASDRPVFSGSTRSEGLPTSGTAYDGSLGGLQDGFVAALAADGSALVYGTYLGGEDFDAAEDVALDAADRPVVVGSASSAQFPTTTGAFQETPNGSQDAFVTQLAADASSLVFSSFLGGDGTDDAFSLVIDDADQIVVTGATTSSNFPTTAGVVSPAPVGGGDVYVTRLAADGSAQLWGTYFGGTGSERGLELVIDSAGRPIVVGATCSSDFPLAGPPLNSDFFTCDGFVTRFDPDVTVALYSTYIGGWRDDTVFALALDERDRIVLGGETFSSNFPATSNAFDTEHNSPDSWFDGFVLEMLTPMYCTTIGGGVDPLLWVTKAIDGNCPAGTPEGNATDLIEGRLESVGPADIGDVLRIDCDSPNVVFGSDRTPPAGFAYFQLARYSPDGDYVDGGNPGLVGPRAPTSGDCP